ncbi:MAG: septum formation initiator family protein [Clostridia bacterium]|nr:septum formation initiator family protein [Clostridia bacterium]
MGKILKRLLKTIIVIAVLLYSGIVLAKQEMSFQKYDNELKNYNTMISEEEIKHEQLISAKNRITTKEYIEEVAREKLGLVMPNEIVFIDGNM